MLSLLFVSGLMEKMSVMVCLQSEGILVCIMVVLLLLGIDVLSCLR
jgi:hypothetical protein